MTVLVTGGAGYIGSHMAHALRDADEPVVVIDDLRSGRRAAVPEGATLVEGDLGDGALLARVMRDHAVTDVLHFAGSTSVPESVAEPLAYYRNNTANSLTLLEAMVETGVGRLIFSSTAAVYKADGTPQVAEDHPVEPASPYGMSKLMTERMIADLAATGAIRAGVLRYFNVAGADPAGRTGQSTPNATHLIKVACEAALGRREGISVYGTDWPTPDGTGVRDYIHVTDLAEAHLLMLRHLRAGGETLTLNCGYGRGFSVRDVLAAVERQSNARLNVTETARRPGDVHELIARSDRLQRELGWRPAHQDLDGIVRDALAWERRSA